jgi:hypothetical protein
MFPIQMTMLVMGFIIPCSIQVSFFWWYYVGKISPYGWRIYMDLPIKHDDFP